MSLQLGPRDAVPCRLVVSSLTRYRAAVVDIRPRRTVHCVDALPCLVLNPGQVDCRAVHYGVCVPVVLHFSPVDILSASSDLNRLVNQFVAADRAVNQNKDKNCSTEVSMLASQSPARPLASSSILSAVEKFERKSLQAKNSSTPTPVRCKRDSSPVAMVKNSTGGSGDGVSTSSTTTTPTNSPTTKYDSCTWPSFKRPVPDVVVKGVGSEVVVVGKTIGDGKKKVEVVGEEKKVVGGSDDGGKINLEQVKKVVKDDKEKVVKNEKSGDKTKKKVRISDKKNLIIGGKTDGDTKLVNGSEGDKDKDKIKTKNVSKNRVDNGKKEKTDAEKKALAEELDKILIVNNQVHLLTDTITSGSVDSGIGSERSSPLKDAVEDTKTNAKFSDQLIASPVDFAKKRFQRSAEQSVTETKTRFENGQIQSTSKDKWRPEWLPSPSLLTTGDPAAEANLVQTTVDVLKRDARQQRMNQRKASSPEPTLPHPKLTVTQKQHIRERSLSPTGYNNGAHVPIRPFLTKGSVAERVLIFERCPTSVVDRDKITNKHPVIQVTAPDAVIPTTQTSVKESGKHSTSPTTRNLHRLSNKSSPQAIQIPHFHFPNGRPTHAKDNEAVLQRVVAAFASLENNRADRDQFGIIAKACDVPLYWKIPLFIAAGGEKKDYVTSEAFLEFWKRILNTCHDDASKFVRILSKGNRNYLLPEDFTPIIQDVVNTHPGLTFLKEAREFHSRYVHTVIARIYYCVNRSWTGRIIAPELRKSNFLQVVAFLEEEDDINQITEYFSYEHFYVIYCKFWELDKDHDLYIDKTDLSRHNEHAISSRMIDRIFSGAVTRGRAQKEQKMSYTEFVWFLISEEDKRHPTSIEYWFRCMDLDGDGYLSMYELEYFYEEQLNRMEALGIETLPFKDCLCQMLDMIRPKTRDLISLSDLKRCRMTSIFFDTFFNLEKYLDHEQRDPFASQREHDIDGGLEMSDWDRYAAEEYEFLVAEEGANDQQEDTVYEDEEDELSSNFEKLALSAVDARRGNLDVEEDYADYADYTESDDYQY